jgi:PhoPQ-activated pathogenicity-related protein
MCKCAGLNAHGNVVNLAIIVDLMAQSVGETTRQARRPARDFRSAVGRRRSGLENQCENVSSARLLCDAAWPGREVWLMYGLEIKATRQEIRSISVTWRTGIVW